jgi:hypothetical protein
MAVRIKWQPPLVPEVRKRAQWEKIIRYELGDLEHPLDVSLRFEEDDLRWKLDTLAEEPTGARHAAESRVRLVDALRAHGKPVC